ncbi:MAG: ABC transporter ATP-binding protein/permease [Bacteroidetes bacterium]|nr:ABC transporter ATP-binding protein/permease [Bacteroidota bacterium]
MKVFLRILGYLKPYWKHLIISTICTVMFAVMSGASVYLTIPLLDTLFQDKGGFTTNPSPTVKTESSFLPDVVTGIADYVSDSFHHFIFSGDTVDILIKICLLILISFFLKNFFDYFQGYYLSIAQQGVIKDLRDAAYKHLNKLPMGFFKKEKTGNLISRIINDITIVQGSITAIFHSFSKDPITIIVFFLIAVNISWHLTIVSFLILPISISMIYVIGKKLRKQSRRIQKTMAEIVTTLHETISGVKVVKAFGMEKFEEEKFTGQNLKYFKSTIKRIRIANLSSPFTEFISVSIGVVIIFYGSSLVLVNNELRASEFMGFLFAIFQMMPPMKSMSTLNNKIQESIASGERIFDLLDTEPNIKNPANPIAFEEFNSTFEFKDVYFHYDDSEELILEDINFTANKGEIIALVGSSGAGKTTLVDLIPRFFDPTSGEILIDGINIRNITLENLRKHLGIVTQETVLFNETVRNNIAYGLKDHPQLEIEKVARIANAHNFIKDLTNGYDTIIGERGTKLSGGQRQRLSIARALLKNPPIMIFDEATSALDNESEVLVQKAIERLMKELTTFVIAHRLSTIRNSDRIIVLDKGKIVQSGKHDELLEDETGIYKKLYELQFRD